MLQSAYDLKEEGRYYEALRVLDDLIKRAPKTAQAWAYRGEIRGRMGELEIARSDLEHAISIEPSPPAYFNLALAHYHASEPPAALAALMRALQLDPFDKEGWAWRRSLAAQIGLEELDIVARALEQFAYSYCGPAIRWRVELRHMFRFNPNGTQVEFNAALLILPQQPTIIIQITIESAGYAIAIKREERIPKVEKLALTDLLMREVTANASILLEELNRMVSQDILRKRDGCLQYNDAHIPAT